MSSVPPSEPSVPPAPPQPPRDLVTAAMIESLRQTKPWVRFLSILGFIASALMVLIAIVIVIVGVVASQQAKAGEGALLIGMGLLYLVLAVLYIFPSRFLFRYAGAIDEALASRYKSGAVERALQHQKSFWKFVGIMTLVMMVVYVPGVLAAIAIPNLLTAMQRSKQKRSMADMRTIATAVELYATDHDAYPRADNIIRLAPLLEPKYVERMPRVDGWGNPFLYEPARCDAGTCTGFYLASGGKNGALEQPLAQYGEKIEGTTTAGDDIVFANGEFVRAP